MVAGVLVDLLTPTIYSYTAKLVNVDETGKAFAILGLANDISSLVGGIAVNRLYRATVDWYPPFTFLVVSGVLLMNSAILLFVHIFSVKDKIEK